MLFMVLTHGRKALGRHRVAAPRFAGIAGVIGCGKGQT
jgi:hypothetical protein